MDILSLRCYHPAIRSLYLRRVVASCPTLICLRQRYYSGPPTLCDSVLPFGFAISCLCVPLCEYLAGRQIFMVKVKGHRSAQSIYFLLFASSIASAILTIASAIKPKLSDMV